MTPEEYYYELGKKERYIHWLQNSERIFCSAGEHRDNYDVVP